MRMPVPTKACHILDIRIVALYETSNVNLLPLDAPIEARVTEEKSPVQFGVMFSPLPPGPGSIRHPDPLNRTAGGPTLG